MHKIVNIIAAVAAAAAILVSMAACGRISALAGQWVSDDLPDVIYTFNKDGTGTISQNEVSFSFNYEEKDDSLEITFTTAETPQVIKYAVDGNKLTITDNDTGSDHTFTKK